MIPIYYKIALGYFCLSIVGGLTYAWVRYHIRRPPLITRETTPMGEYLVIRWKYGQMYYTSKDGYAWHKRWTGKLVSERKALRLRKLVETYGWKEL